MAKVNMVHYYDSGKVNPQKKYYEGWEKNTHTAIFPANRRSEAEKFAASVREPRNISAGQASRVVQGDATPEMIRSAKRDGRYFASASEGLRTVSSGAAPSGAGGGSSAGKASSGVGSSG